MTEVTNDALSPTKPPTGTAPTGTPALGLNAAQTSSIANHAAPKTGTENAATVDAQPMAPVELPKNKKQGRTTGLYLFDVFLYPFLTNFVVFAISVWATYMTSHGGKKGVDGKPLYGPLARAVNVRGEKFMQFLEHKIGMKSKDTREMTKMVFFSFADGTIVSPGVKLLEDRRENIAKHLDLALGTTPKDESVYQAEPKQGWGSVVGGRLAVASIIVPIAATLENVGLKDGSFITKKAAGKDFVSLNDRMFTRTGERWAAWFKRNPGISNLFGKNTEMNGLSKTMAFEAFYTTVCTISLYFVSRFIATLSGKKKKPEAEATATTTPATTAPVETSTTNAAAPFVPGVKKENPVEALESTFAQGVETPVTASHIERTSRTTPLQDRAPQPRETAPREMATEKETGKAWGERVQIDPTLSQASLSTI